MFLLFLHDIYVGIHLFGQVEAGFKEKIEQFL